MVHILILDMKRILINLVRHVEINLSHVYLQQQAQRTIQTSTNRLQSVEEVLVDF
jgi:hypothetical protein